MVLIHLKELPYKSHLLFNQTTVVHILQNIQQKNFCLFILSVWMETGMETGIKMPEFKMEYW